jgi:hypothetical protein
MVLSLSIQTSAQTALLKYFDKESIDSNCQNCTGKVAIKRDQLQSAPTVLALHLKRFTNALDKNSANMIINESLKITLPGTENQLTYRLRSLTNHIGAELFEGHFTAHVRAFDKKVYKISDNMVEIADGFPIDSSEVYLMFYELEQPVNRIHLQEIGNGKYITQNLLCKKKFLGQSKRENKEKFENFNFQLLLPIILLSKIVKNENFKFFVCLANLIS